jgi:threonine/homoserine/homoserine lactone efflux protein
MLTYLILGMTYAFAAAAQPGPFQAYLISQGVCRGWRRALPAAFAPLLSDAPAIVLVVLVLSRVPAWFTRGLRLTGGLFLLYLAFSAARAWRAYGLQFASQDLSPRQSILRAALVNVLNPNLYIGWSLVMGPLLLRGWRETPAHGIALLAGFYGVLVSCSAGIIALSATAGSFGPRVSRALMGLAAAALGCCGCYLLWSGIGG